MNMIVAAGADGAIGQSGSLIWHIPADLRRFKALTIGHPVIMGRKTWESLPRRPLPGRRNIVVTRNPLFSAEGAVTVSSPEEARRLTDGEGAFIIGGAEIYAAMLPYTTRIFLTEIDAAAPEADARLAIPPLSGKWSLEETTPWETTPDGIRYRYTTYRRDI